MLGRERPCSANWALVNLNARRVRRVVPLALTAVERAARVTIKPCAVVCVLGSTAAVRRPATALRAANVRCCCVHGSATVRPVAARKVAAMVLVARVLKVGAVISLVVVRRRSVGQQYTRRAARRRSHAARASAVVIGN